VGLRLPVAAAKGRAKLLPDNNTYEINPDKVAKAKQVYDGTYK
jgi:hypothetical protein